MLFKRFFVSLGAVILQYLKSFIGWLKFFIKTIVHNKKALIGAIILLFFAFLAIFGRLIVPFDGSTSYDAIYLPPSTEHWFGTDALGRDVFSMIIYGTQDVLSVALYTAVFTVAIGTIIGLFSGFIGGVFDSAIGLGINVFMSIPSFPLLIIIAHFLTINDNVLLSALLALFAWPGLARAIRSQVVSLKQRDFIQICRVMNMSTDHVIFKELLPNIFSYVAISFINSMRNGITASIGLMTIGAVTYEVTNWGGIIITARANGAMSIPDARLCIIAPIVAIMIFQIGAILFSNGLDELVNPRLREK